MELGWDVALNRRYIQTRYQPLSLSHTHTNMPAWCCKYTGGGHTHTQPARTDSAAAADRFETLFRPHALLSLISKDKKELYVARHTNCGEFGLVWTGD